MLKPMWESGCLYYKRGLSRQTLWLVSFAGLPYFMYGSLLVVIYLLVSALWLRSKQIGRACHQAGFSWLAAALLLSASVGLNRGDAFLQLVNFLPFFALWGVFVTQPQVVAQPFAVLEKLAWWLVMGGMPMCAIALIEYGLKLGPVVPRVKALALPEWFVSRLYEGYYLTEIRTRGMFDNPNILGGYLVIILGLGLGLLLKALSDDKPGAARRTGWLGTAIALCLAALFCSGSRNGMLVTLVLIAITLYRARHYKWVWLSSLVGLGAIVVAAANVGVGGRSLSLSLFTSDVRFQVWPLALDMIQSRPWLGWGFSGFRDYYIAGTIPGYDYLFHPHNIFLFLAVGAGIPAMLGFCLSVGTIVYRATKAYVGHDAYGPLSSQKKALLFSYLLAFSGCVLFSMLDVVLFDARLNVLIWGILAALYVLPLTLKQR